MKPFMHAIAGGLVVLLGAAALGAAQNALRDQPLKLVSRVPAASPGPGGDGSNPAPDHAAGGADAAIGDSAQFGAEDVKRMAGEGTIILDARAPDAFAEGHIPGAINIPYDQLPAYLGALQEQVQPEDAVVAYCWGPDCDFSHQLATEMELMGYTRVSVYSGGWESWTEAGYPVETGGGQ